MTLKNNLKYFNSICFKILIFSFVILSLGCQTDGFKENAIELGKILQHAQNLLELSNVSNTVVQERIEEVTFFHDATKARAYLHEKKNIIQRCYENVNKNLDKTTINYVDALYVLALTNEILYLITGNDSKDRCKYLSLLKKESIRQPSEWVIDDVFGPVLGIKEYVPEWISMEKDAKYNIISTIFSNCDNGTEGDQAQNSDGDAGSVDAASTRGRDAGSGRRNQQ